MDYNYFAAVTQSFQYPSYKIDGSFSLDQGHDSTNVSPDHSDASLFLSNPFQDFSPWETPGSTGSNGVASDAASPGRPSLNLELSNGSVDSGIGGMDANLLAMDLDMDGTTGERRGSSEEKESLTPAQSRRKAQNRAAQRAFRERKEKHVRELEAKLTLLTSKTTTSQSDNERLKSLIQRIQTENEILRATSGPGPYSQNPPSMVDDPRLLRASSGAVETGSDEDEDGGSVHSCASSARDSTVNTPASSNTYPSRYSSAGATWDLLQSHPLYMSGAVDVGEVCERSKRSARCEGAGPVFDEAEVRRVIEDVARMGSDELI